MELKKSLLALILGSSVALAACGGGDDAAQDAENAVDEAEQNTEEAVDEAQQNTEEAVDEAEQGTEDAVDEATPEEGADDATTAAAGEEVYKQSCLSCHGGNLEGGFGPALDKAGANYSKDEILDIIHNGKGQMPANVVEGENAEAVAAWLAEKK